ncbi:Sir2 family NAD-dependent protein deacetylase, partial [Escherichia coli]|uniref:Sir2 family NAD-dependent protein deacetylase n=1 Tax=Escherichia coli TaxID=562 RepID=UPI0025A519D5
GFDRDPELVQAFYNARRRQLQQPEIQPNAAHLALAKLQDALGDRFLLVTQNIDNLHERAGNTCAFMQVVYILRYQQKAIAEGVLQ